MYIKTTTSIFPEAVTIAKAMTLAGKKFIGQINQAIKDDKLDYAYAFDELEKPVKKQARPGEGNDKFGQKLVVLNEKWNKYLADNSK